MVDSKDDKPKMIYRYLGPTGMRVSALSYGNYRSEETPDAQKFTTDSIRKCLEYGVNFFDTAEGYGRGIGETLMGNAFQELKVKRDDIVVSTKIFFLGLGEKGTKAINTKGLSRKHIIEGTKASLKRLQMKYVDIIFAHRPDHKTPLEETCRAFSWLIEKGLAFYWGTSEWPAPKIAEAIELCRKHKLHPPVVEQPEYSMLTRKKVEDEYRYLFERYKFGTTCWSPLAGGILAGKFNDGNVPTDSRFSTSPLLNQIVLPKFFGPTTKEKTMKILASLVEVSNELGCSQTQLALAWGLANSDVSTLIMGFTKLEQIDQNIQALKVYQEKWTPELEARLEKILSNAPEDTMNFLNFSFMPSRRKIHTSEKKAQ